MPLFILAHFDTPTMKAQFSLSIGDLEYTDYSL